MHPIKRAILIFVFGLGTVGGFAHGFASLGHCAARHREARRMEFEDHVADVCLRAAERREHDAARVAPPYPPPHFAAPGGAAGWAPGWVPAYPMPIEPTNAGAEPALAAPAAE